MRFSRSLARLDGREFLAPRRLSRAGRASVPAIPALRRRYRRGERRRCACGRARQPGWDASTLPAGPARRMTGRRCSRSCCCGGSTSPPCADLRRRNSRTCRRRSRIHAGASERAELRYLGGGERIPLFHAACAGRGARARRRMARERRRRERGPAPAAPPRERSPRASTALWDASAGFYRSRTGVENGDPRKALDIAVVLATLHAGREAGAAQRARSASASDACGAGAPVRRRIRDQLPSRAGPAMGRYAGRRLLQRRRLVCSDAGGGRVLFPTRHGAALRRRDARDGRERAISPRLRAERAAARPAWTMPSRAARAATLSWRPCAPSRPASGELSEQFDRTTGAQTSAKRLAWSYAAFITAAASRRRACAAR